MDIHNEFILETYFTNLEIKIKNILLKIDSENLTFDILDTEKSKKNKLIALKEKQRQMKIGIIWQEAMGSYKDFENLGIGHITGLDIMSKQRKIIAEIKNRTNTDNASSKKSNYDKLSNFQIRNPEYKCIYGNVNDSSEEKTNTGNSFTILHNEVEIEVYVGIKFLELIFGENCYKIIQFIRNTIDKYSA